MDRMRRASIVPLLAVVVTALSVGAVQAKTPVPFEVEVSPSTVTSGDAITVTVTMAADGDFPVDVLTQLVGLAPRPADDVVLRPLSGHVEVPLTRIRKGVYQATLDAPDGSGEYVLVPYPTATAWGNADVYPEPAFVTVTGRAWLSAGAWPLVILTGFAGVAFVFRRHRPGAASRCPGSPG